MKKTLATAALLATALSATALASADAAPSHHGTRAQAHQRAGHSYQVVAKVNNTQPELNDKVTIRATVRPAAPGAQVTLQVKYQDQKAWKTIGHKRLKATGKVSFKDKAGSVRSRKYRVVKPADSRAGAGSGETAKVTVYGWRTLTSLDPVLSQGLYEAGNANINGISYPSSILGSTGHIDYNLNRGCKQLDAVYGLSDSSTSGGSTTLTLTADGVQKHTGVYALTQAQRVMTDVTGVFRITISAGALGGGVPAVGEPKVLCSF
jgi:NPCBM/NEW2 domain